MHGQAKKRRTTPRESRRPGRVVALASRRPAGRGRSFAASTWGDVNICKSTSMQTDIVRGQIASGARVASRESVCVRGFGSGSGAGLHALEKTPCRMDRRPKAPW